MKKKANTSGAVGVVFKVFLWLVALPIMLALLLYKKGVLSKKIAVIIGAVGTVIWLIIIMASGGGQSRSTVDANGNPIPQIESLTFNNTNDVMVEVGDTYKASSKEYLKASMKQYASFSPDMIQFVSENPEIATIKIVDGAYATSIKYTITGVAAGETFVYAITTDGSVESQKIRVYVPKPIEAESIDIQYKKMDLAIGETVKPKVEILPSNTKDKTISWSSSDKSIASVDKEGVVKGIGDGTVTITATTSNGISHSIDFVVDGSKHLMNVKTSRVRTNDIDIGSEWSYQTEINGESIYNTIAISAGENLKFWAKFTEEDKNPDVGEASTSYVVREEDLANGFEVSMNISVRENGGKNSGKTADYLITFTFTPAK